MQHNLTVKWNEEEQAAYIGKIKGAAYFWDDARPSGDPNKYSVRSTLPQIKNYLGNFKTEEDAKRKCISACNTFIRLLTENN